MILFCKQCYLETHISVKLEPDGDEFVCPKHGTRYKVNGKGLLELSR